MAKLKLTTKIKRNKGVTFKEVEDVVYILDPHSSIVYTLNETASFIWQSLKTPHSIKELSDLMTKEFKVEKKKAARDIEDFIKEYLKQGLLLQG